MKSAAKLAIVIAGLSISTAALALSSAMKFETFISPGQYFKMPTSQLYSGPYYELSCYVNDTKTNSADTNAIRITSNGWITANIDGKEFKDATVIVAKTKMAGSRLKISKVSQSSVINMYNYDYSDTIKLACTADVMEEGSH